MAVELNLISKNKSFGGYQCVYSFKSDSLKSCTKFSIFLPPGLEETSSKFPVIYWLSGLTCNEQNFITKSGFQKYAAQYHFIVVAPDTSPRGVEIEGEKDNWDFGEGAGFYLDATEDKWKTHYNMYSFVSKELPMVIKENFPVDPCRQSIMGHSMGGHGALSIYFKNQGLFKSVSAFAPICHPTKCPWGQKAFKGYLGDGDKGEEYDSTLLCGKYHGPKNKILIDQGSEDEFLSNGQLLPEKLVEACNHSNIPISYRLQKGYDHSYYFIASFIEDHFKHHASFLS